MDFLNAYDIPEEVCQGPHSAAFRQFLHHWFVDSFALSRGEVDVSFINDLTPHENEIAKGLLRRNLKLRYTHIIEGAAVMADVGAVPLLRAMLADEPDLSRQLTIAGTLWKLVRDPSFVDCLNRMKASESSALKQAHFHQILWIGDERAIDLLIDMLEDKDKFVRFLALSTLNGLESGHRFQVPENKLPCRAADYQKRRQDRVLRELLVGNLATIK